MQISGATSGYQQAVQNAFRDVNDSLIGRAQTAKQLDALKRQVGSLIEYEEIARLRYDNGYTDYLTVLDAERNLFNAELQYTQTHASLHQALIGLYKAMGGGWVATADKMATPPAQ